MILYFIGTTEMIAKLFRISQSEEKLKNDKVPSADEANKINFIVGKEVSGTIEIVGGTMPDDLPVLQKLSAKWR
jgi:DNA-damage-inducible protein D